MSKIKLPTNNFNTNKKSNKNTKHKKSKTDLIKKVNSFRNKDINKSKNILLDSKNNTTQKKIEYKAAKKIEGNKILLEKIKYLQLWWKTIFQIIKIQKYLRGFLYRIKLLKLLEIKEKVLYGIIQLSKCIKRDLFNNIIQKIKNIIFQKQKFYFNIWSNLVIKKTIVKKLKTFDKSKIIKKNDKIKKVKKLKSNSMKKRDLNKDKRKEKEVKFDENYQTLEKIEKKEKLSLSIGKEGLETSRINTEKNIHNCIKNNSIEKRPVKKNIDKLIGNNSNFDLKMKQNNKKQCQFYKTSSNFLMNKSQNQLKNNKFRNKNNFNFKSNQIQLSKKNTNIQKNKKLKNNRNKNIGDRGFLENNLNKFKSYCVESSRNKLKKGGGINISKELKPKKISQLEYISTHENRFHCPKQLYSLNRKKNLKKNESIDFNNKLDISFQKTTENKESNTIKNEKPNNNTRARSLESRHNKKFKSFVQNINNNNLINNGTNKEFELNKNISFLELPKNEEQKKIIKSKTKVMKKGKKKNNVQKNPKGILKTQNHNIHKNKDNNKNNKNILPWLISWRKNNIKIHILNKLRGISKINNYYKLYVLKKNGNEFIKLLKKNQQYKILFNNFNKYRNLIFTKIIIKKLKENYKNKKNNNDLNENSKINNNEYNNETQNEKDSKINIIEISPYQDTKINCKIKNNKIKIESKIKLQKVLIIKKRVNEYEKLKKYFNKWKMTNIHYIPNLTTEFKNMKNFYFNNKQNSQEEKENEKQRINSSYHKKRVKYHQNFNLESSIKEDKLYNTKVIDNFNSNNIHVQKEDNFNKSQPEINYFDNYNNPQHQYNFSNLITSSHNNENNNNRNNFISNSPIQIGIYKKKRIINNKNSNINKNVNNISCVLGEVNNSKFNTLENEKEFMNNSMVMGRRRKNNYNDIYYPKYVDPNLEENESIYGKRKIEIKEENENPNKNNHINNNNVYKKMNVRYQKMYYDNDIISEHKNVNLGLLEEQTNEGTN